MKALKTQPVAVAVAVATFIDACIGLAMALEWIEPEVGTPMITIVTAAVGLVKKVVTPVEKVAQVLDTTVEGANNILKGVKL